MKTALKLAAYILLTVPMMAQATPQTAQSPQDPQQKSLGELARETNQETKPAPSKVLQNEDLVPSDLQPTTSEQKDAVQHFQDFASSHSAEETRSELQSWMHGELLKMLGNSSGESGKTNEQLIEEAKGYAPAADAARIEQLLKQIRDAGLLDDTPAAQDPPAK